jgi:7tm Chemosensory receptor
MENVYTAARPFYVLSKALGLFPLSVDGPMTKGIFTLKRRGAAGSTISVVTPILLIIWLFYVRQLDERPTEKLMKVWIIEMVFGVLLIFVQFFIQLPRCRQIVRFLEDVNSFDRRVSRSPLVERLLTQKLSRQGCATSISIIDSIESSPWG